MEQPGTDESGSASHAIAHHLLRTILTDFGLAQRKNGSAVTFIGEIPSLAETNSGKINLSYIGAIPSLANAIVATQIYEGRGGRPQEITLDLRKAHNYLDPNIGMTPTINGQEITIDLVAGNPFLGNIFETRDGRHVVVSAVYVDLVYQWSAFLQCSVVEEDVRAAIKRWDASHLEAACAKAALPMAVIRSEKEWLATSQGAHLAQLPIVPIRKATSAPPKPLSRLPSRPLEGLKVICATHAIAGPSAGRTLAEHGASVLQVMYTHGFEHDFVYTYANLGCASTRMNFNREGDRKRMWDLIREADVWIDSYREGALSKFGFTDTSLHQANASLIISHVRCYGSSGPWASKPGFDMQGSASSGLMAVCGEGVHKPEWPPGMVINDYTTGYYGALAIQAAVLRRTTEGGGYVLSPSLTGTAMSIVKYFQSASLPKPVTGIGEALPPDELVATTGMGILRTLKPLPVLSATPPKYDPIVLPARGSGLPFFPDSSKDFDVNSVEPIEKGVLREALRGQLAKRMVKLKELGEEWLDPQRARL